jgi:hypothetical protein
MAFPLPPSALDQTLVFEFFWKFSAFECALKREGFLKPAPYADPDWKAFGKTIRNDFQKIRLADFSKSVEMLKQLSPKRQINRNGKLAWESVTRTKVESEEEYVIKLLKIVRNNLFHGGKYPDGQIVEVTRDRNILRAALNVLNGCYELHPGIKNNIDEIAA